MSLSLTIPQALPSPSDHLAALLINVGKHDRGAFSKLYEKTSAKLFGIILRILRNKSLSEDILQEVYIKIWERAGDYDTSRGSPITWMAAIARNRALDEARKPQHMVAYEEVPSFEDIPALDLDSLGLMEQRQEYKKLAHCLQGLNPEKRDMIVYAYHHGASREFLALKFSQPLSTVKTWLRRSLQSLKSCLDL